MCLLKACFLFAISIWTISKVMEMPLLTADFCVLSGFATQINLRSLPCFSNLSCRLGSSHFDYVVIFKKSTNCEWNL